MRILSQWIWYHGQDLIQASPENKTEVILPDDCVFNCYVTAEQNVLQRNLIIQCYIYYTSASSCADQGYTGYEFQVKHSFHLT
jgi:hypothetical protein